MAAGRRASATLVPAVISRLVHGRSPVGYGQRRVWWKMPYAEKQRLWGVVSRCQVPDDRADQMFVVDLAVQAHSAAKHLTSLVLIFFTLMPVGVLSSADSSGSGAWLVVAAPLLAVMVVLPLQMRVRRRLSDFRDALDAQLSGASDYHGLEAEPAGRRV